MKKKKKKKKSTVLTKKEKKKKKTKNSPLVVLDCLFANETFRLERERERGSTEEEEEEEEEDERPRGGLLRSREKRERKWWSRRLELCSKERKTFAGVGDFERH